MAGSERYRISTFWFWLIVLQLNEAAIIILFLPRSYLQETLTHEEQMVTTQLSSETLGFVTDRTRNLFQVLVFGYRDRGRQLHVQRLQGQGQI